MPTDTCTVDVLPADHTAASDPHTLGTVGPLDDRTGDQARCNGTPMPPRPTSPTTARNGAAPPTTTVASAPTAAAPPTYAPTTR